MRDNPVLSESLEVFFGEGHGFAVYFYLLIILAPVEFLSLSGKLGAQVRATVHSFGAVLLGKVMDLNETQTSVLSLIFKYCDDNALPLLDLADLATTLKFLASDEGQPILDDYGGMSSASVGVLLRSIVVLQQEGTDVFIAQIESHGVTSSIKPRGCGSAGA